MFEKVMGKKVRISYFRYTGTSKEERFIFGTIVSEDADFVQIRGNTDNRLFGINKKNIIEWREPR